MSAAESPASTESRGPCFDELRHGQVFDGAPWVTLTAGVTAERGQPEGDADAVLDWRFSVLM